MKHTTNIPESLQICKSKHSKHFSVLKTVNVNIWILFLLVFKQQTPCTVEPKYLEYSNF